MAIDKRLLAISNYGKKKMEIDPGIQKTVRRIRLKQRQKEIFLEVSKNILFGLIFGTMFAVVMTNPTALHRLVVAYLKDKKKMSDTDAKMTYEKLRKERFIKICRNRDKYVLRITNKGRWQLVEFNIDTIQIQKQSWDGKWRIIIFDIPEKYRLARDVLRQKLKDIGFLKIQKSVFVYPYECENEINFICEVYGIYDYVNYIVAEKIDIDSALKQKFSLK